MFLCDSGFFQEQHLTHMHTVSTLDHMDVFTTQLRHALHQFVSATCVAFVTHELPHEVAACAYHHAKGASSDNPSLLTHTAMPIAKTKQFNLTAPNHHFLGDYFSTTKQLRTTDSYSIQTVRVSW